MEFGSQCAMLSRTAKTGTQIFSFGPPQSAHIFSRFCGVGFRSCVIGSDEEDDLFVLDLQQHHRGDTPATFSFDGAGQRTSRGDALMIFHDGGNLSYRPDPAVFGAGVIQAGASTVFFTGLEPVYVENIDTLTFEASIDDDSKGSDFVTVST